MTVPTIGEADVICGLLRVEGIDADFDDYSPGRPSLGYEIFVKPSDLERAREVITPTAEGPRG